MMGQPSQLPELDAPAGGARWFWLVLLVAVVVGGSLRLYGLNGGSLWIDEIYTVRDMSDPFTMDRPTRHFGYLPIGAVLYGFDFQQPKISIEDIGSWREQGLEPWHIRLAPCLIGILSILVLGIAVRNALGARIGAVFAVLLALAPWHIFWSQLGRYYSLKFLLIALGLALYYQATRHDRIRMIIPAMVCVYFGFLCHAPGAGIGLVFLIDVVVGFLRKQPVRLGRLGYAAGTVCALAILGTMLAEHFLIGEGYSNFVGSTPDSGQSAPLLIANVAYMMQPALLLAALMGLVVLSKLHNRSNSGWFWLAAAAVPVIIMAGFGAMGKFAQARYAFEGLFGVLVLASIGLVYAWRALEPRFGKVAASFPSVIVVSAMLLLVVQYHTTGHHLHRRWVDAYEYIEKHRQPGEVVLSARPEIGRYYLGDNSVKREAGLRYILDRRADGKPAWCIDLGGQATGNYRWKFAEHADLKAVFPIRVWQPYTELFVYLYHPRPLEVWQPEAEAADRDAGLDTP